jgi:hypothetical protein
MISLINTDKDVGDTGAWVIGDDDDVGALVAAGADMGASVGVAAH